MRNLWRNKRRSALALTSVALSVLLCVFLQGFIGGFVASIVKNYTKNDTGHIRITTEGYLSRSEFMPVDENISDPAVIERKIMADPSVAEHIALMTERIRFGVLLENKGFNKNAVALAGDPKTEENLLYLQRSIEPGGRYIEGPRETIVGAKLAKELRLATGDKLKVVTQAADGSLQLRKFTIVGIFNTGVGTLDDSVFQIPLQDAKQFLRTNGGVQQIIIMLKDYRNADSVAASIRSLLGNDKIAVTPWTAIGDYPQIVNMMENIYGFIYVVVLFLGVFIITNIMMMVVLERRREIGILKSMGFSRREVLVLFLWEGVLLGIWGSIAGAFVGFGISVWLHFNGLDLTSMLSSINFPLDNVIYFQLNIPRILGLVALGALISGVVSVLPSRRAARMNAVDAIKSV